MEPIVEVLMATYNGQAHVAQQIDSILNQSFPSFRLIIRDDNSTDDTRSILKEYVDKYPEKVVLLPTEKNLGIRANFSRLMESAIAPYVMLSDQDDVWDRDKMALTYARMRELEQKYGKQTPILIHTDLRVADRDLKVFNRSFWKFANFYPKKGRTLNRLLIQNVITGCTIMMNQPLVKKALPIPQETMMHDWWIGLVASAFGVIGYVDKTTMLYRQHGFNTLGAQPFSILKGLKKVLNLKNVNNYKQNEVQAFAFKERYLTNLSPGQIELLNSYLKLIDCSVPKHLYLTLKYRFFRQGVIRNLGTVAFKMLNNLKLLFPSRTSS